MEDGVSAGARDYGRSAALLTVAVGLAGVLTYLFFALASHALDRDDYGQIVVLWSAMFILISVLFRPVEQLLSRTIAELETCGRHTRHAVRVAAQIQLAIAIGFAVVALLFRGEIEDRLFAGDELFFWALIASVLGFAASFFARGYLAGTGRFGLYSGLIVIDALAKLVLALAVSIGVLTGADPIALGIAIAPAMSATVGLLAVRPADRDASPPVAGAGRDFSLAEGRGFAAAMVVVMLSEQVFLNSGILFVRLDAGLAAAGFIFNVLMVARAPVVIFQAAATTLLPHLTRLRSGGGADDEESFEASVNLTLAAVAAFAGLTLAVVAIAGPGLMQLAFGDKFSYGRADLMIVAVGMGAFLAATTVNQAVLAQDQAARAARCWLFSAVALVGWSLLPILEVARRVEVGFAAGSALLLILLYGAYRAGREDGGAALEPGSPAEREASLATAGG